MIKIHLLDFHLWGSNSEGSSDPKKCKLNLNASKPTRPRRGRVATPRRARQHRKIDYDREEASRLWWSEEESELQEHKEEDIKIEKPD